MDRLWVLIGSTGFFLNTIFVFLAESTALVASAPCFLIAPFAPFFPFDRVVTGAGMYANAFPIRSPCATDESSAGVPPLLG